MIVGCYDMHLYCDGGGDSYGANCPHTQGVLELTGKNERECLKQARDLGWTFKLDSKAYCAGCSK